jgi:hypothetical protein
MALKWGRAKTPGADEIKALRNIYYIACGTVREVPQNFHTEVPIAQR